MKPSHEAIGPFTDRAKLPSPIIGAFTFGTLAQRRAVLREYLDAGGSFRPAHGRLCLWLSPTEAIVVLESDVEALTQGANI